MLMAICVVLKLCDMNISVFIFEQSKYRLPWRTEINSGNKKWLFLRSLHKTYKSFCVICLFSAAGFFFLFGRSFGMICHNVISRTINFLVVVPITWFTILCIEHGRKKKHIAMASNRQQRFRKKGLMLCTG